MNDDEYTPSMETIRRHWNDAVGSNRRAARDAEFTRMLEAHEVKLWMQFMAAVPTNPEGGGIVYESGEDFLAMLEASEEDEA